MTFGRFAATLSACVLSTTALAQETLDLGKLTDDDITVVQPVLFPKVGRTELGVHLGLMPDAFLLTPNLQVSLDLHQRENFAISVLVGGGYGLKNLTARRIEGEAFGAAPYTYRYLASALVGVQAAPIYAKMNLGGARVVHFDIYFGLRGGVSLEQSVIPDGSLSLAPTASPAIGSRFFLNDTTTLRVEIRDDVLIERRALTQNWVLKQNAGITIGITKLGGAK